MPMERVYIRETSEFLRIVNFADNSTRRTFSNTEDGALKANLMCFEINNLTDDIHAERVMTRLKRIGKKIPANFVIQRTPLIVNRITRRLLLPKAEEKKNG